jgi:DNA-binding NarL/FixJ family response regulator
MMRTKLLDEKLRQQRLDAKSLDNLFRRQIEQGANCSPFVSAAILQTVKDVFPVSPEDADNPLRLGQIKLLVVAAQEPAGKALEQCQKVTVLLTLDAALDDYQTRLAFGVEGLRRARILRMTAEARDQGGLLSYEDLAYRLLNCGVRTIVRDVNALRKRDIEVPSRGQQQDIGPGQTHRVQAVRLYLQGLEANEIARRLYHTLASIENYVTTFARVVFLDCKGYGSDEIAFVIRRSSILVDAYRQLYRDFEGKRSARQRLREILGRADKNPDFHAKKGGLPS